MIANDFDGRSPQHRKSMDTLLIVTGFAFSIFIWNIHCITFNKHGKRGQQSHESHGQGHGRAAECPKCIPRSPSVP